MFILVRFSECQRSERGGKVLSSCDRFSSGFLCALLGDGTLLPRHPRPVKSKPCGAKRPNQQNARDYEPDASALSDFLLRFGELPSLLELALPALLLALFLLGLARVAGGDIGPIGLSQEAGEIRPQAQTLGVLQPPAAMGEPGRVLAARLPIARGAPDAFERRQGRRVLDEPSLQQSPLPEQCLMCWLDRDLAGARGDVSCEQPLLDQKLDERAGLLPG